MSPEVIYWFRKLHGRTGGVVGRNAETALAMARALTWLGAHSWESDPDQEKYLISARAARAAGATGIVWEEDPYVMDDDVGSKEAVAAGECQNLSCLLFVKGECVASVGGVVIKSVRELFARMIEAELVLEWGGA